MEYKSRDYSELFEDKAKELGLHGVDRKLAFVFWSAFQKGTVAKLKGLDGDEVRNDYLSDGLRKLGATFKTISVGSDMGPVSLYTVNVNGEDLIYANGSVKFLLADASSFTNCSAMVGLSNTSSLIIEGEASIHEDLMPGMRSDLRKPSRTMTDHFIEAIQSVALRSS